MDKAASVFLRSDIHPEDVSHLIRWLRNRNVTRYLNEDASAPEQLEQLLRATPPPLLTCRLNQHGRFFLICRNWGPPLGFVKLTPHGPGVYEIVFAVGEQSLWGQGYGSLAVQAALRQAFFEWRAEKLIARIYQENLRSVNTVCGCGFVREHRGGNLDRYRITMAEYLETLQAPARKDRKPAGSLA
ncbi:GNAT family N-acetyltransferase [Dysosmobacter sp.]|uniref:GNAT family N-acetyltransferase n=1 Tax=Dysosmobacter sp. TaxID=2591382 RepID=UPI002A86D7DE|nr:GNAT family N-acetyltransferase [Dysosmobacter sp.]MDY3281107.1 GNAT family N-acetyltransferase [Dysosmobacter sp.]